MEYCVNCEGYGRSEEEEENTKKNSTCHHKPPRCRPVHVKAPEEFSLPSATSRSKNIQKLTRGKSWWIFRLSMTVDTKLCPSSPLQENEGKKCDDFFQELFMLLISHRERGKYPDWMENCDDFELETFGSNFSQDYEIFIDFSLTFENWLTSCEVLLSI